MPTKRKGAKRKQRGAGIAKDLHKFIKDNKLISKGLALLPVPGAGYASTAAGMLGYGKKKKRKTRRVAVTVPVASSLVGTRSVQNGTGFFSDLGGGIGNVFGGLGGGIGSVARGLFGGGVADRRNVIKTTY